MTTKAEANRQNAQHSTGPKTPEGKAKVSRNRVRHGAYSEALTILQEDPEEFEALRAGMVEHFGPAGPMEANLVERMASLWWRGERTKRAANQGLWLAAKRRLANTDDEELAAVIYGSNAGMVLRDEDECRVSTSWNMDQQERLLRHETTLERNFYRARHELERLQASRQGVAVPVPVSVDVNFESSR